MNSPVNSQEQGQIYQIACGAIWPHQAIWRYTIHLFCIRTQINASLSRMCSWYRFYDNIVLTDIIGAEVGSQRLDLYSPAINHNCLLSLSLLWLNWEYFRKISWVESMIHMSHVLHILSDIPCLYFVIICLI